MMERLRQAFAKVRPWPSIGNGFGKLTLLHMLKRDRFGKSIVSTNGQHHQHRAGILCRIVSHRAGIEKTGARFQWAWALVSEWSDGSKASKSSLGNFGPEEHTTRTSWITRWAKIWTNPRVGTDRSSQAMSRFKFLWRYRGHSTWMGLNQSLNHTILPGFQW